MSDRQIVLWIAVLTALTFLVILYVGRPVPIPVLPPTSSETLTSATEPLSGIAAALQGRLVVFRNGKLEEFDARELRDVRYWAFFYSSRWICAGQEYNRAVYNFYDRFAAKHSKELALIFVSGDRSEENLIAGMREQNVHCPAVRYGKNTTAPLNLDKFRFGNLYVPHLVLVDQNGTLLADSFHVPRQETFDLQFVFDAIRKLPLSPER